jgi:uncharacterized damage-inducible protein DinB
MDAATIEKYAEGGAELAESVRGLDLNDFLAFPVPGTWSIQQIVWHMADSDLIGSDRMKRVIAEDHPTLMAYDENRFASRLHYDALDPFLAVEIFALNRRITAEILRRLEPATFKRTGMHTETGEKTLEKLVTGYIDHLEHHLKFVREKRKLLGK